MSGREGKGSKEPRWKRRIKDSIAELRRHVNILERSKQGKLKRKEKYTKLERKYNITQKGEKVVIEELKQGLQAKSAKLKRYEQSIHQYQVMNDLINNRVAVPVWLTTGRTVLCQKD